MSIRKLSALVLTVLAVLFIIQNIAIVEIQFLFWSFSLPRSVFLVLFIVIGFLAGWLIDGSLFKKKEE